MDAGGCVNHVPHPPEAAVASQGDDGADGSHQPPEHLPPHPHDASSGPRVPVVLEHLDVDVRIPQHRDVRPASEGEFFLQMSGFHLNLLAAELSVLTNVNPWLAERRHEVERMSIEPTSVHDAGAGILPLRRHILNVRRTRQAR